MAAARSLPPLQQSGRHRHRQYAIDHENTLIDHENTLIDHEGKLIEDVGGLWDQANQRYVIAHDYGISNYVGPTGAHYPIEWRRFRKREACAAGEFLDHTQLCI